MNLSEVSLPTFTGTPPKCYTVDWYLTRQADGIDVLIDRPEIFSINDQMLTITHSIDDYT